MARPVSGSGGIALLIILAIFSACAKGTQPTGENPGPRQKLENEIRKELDNYETDADFTLMVESANGKRFSHSTGSSGESVLYRSASTSKLVTAVVILTLVEDSLLSLGDHPGDYIPSWPDTGNLAAITLRHLLSFTSGLADKPFCLNLPSADFEECVARIAGVNANARPPGEEFYYSPGHLQVAGLMAVKASGLASWQELFTRFKSKTGLFPNGNYDLPSLQNPRLAGGMHWNAAEYLAFLRALYEQRILGAGLIAQMTEDQLRGAAIGYSPSLAAIGEDWHYGFGLWIECHDNPFNCNRTTRVSSPGAYGAYPFIDYENRYYGILAREGAYGTFDKGYRLFESIAPKLEEWALMSDD